MDNTPNLLEPTRLPPIRPWYRRRKWVWLGLAVAAGWLVWANLAPLPNQSPAVNLGFTAAPGASGTKTTQADVVTADDPSRGPASAPITVVEFGDFQCPFCRESAAVFKQVLAKYPEAVRLIYRDFPVPQIHTEAVAAAEAANCAFEQGKFWQYHDALYNRQEELGPVLYQALARELKLDTERFANCQVTHRTVLEIQDDAAAGAAAGVRGTPTWFINGHKVEGSLTRELWEQVIIAALKEKFGR